MTPIGRAMQEGTFRAAMIRPRGGVHAARFQLLFPFLREFILPAVSDHTCEPLSTLNRPGDCLLEAKGVSKSFGGVKVLSPCSLCLQPGEVHALMGENGAGKSTLMKIIAGVLTPDSGEVRVDSSVLRPGSAQAALQAGVALIHQELLPVPNLSVAENIFLGHEPVKNRLGWIDRPEMRRRSRELLDSLGLNVPPGRAMRSLNLAEMQIVEIAKALAHDARVILMDEPTSALSEREAEALFRIISDLQRAGAAVVYISHKIEEVFRLADRVTVLRDGSHVATRVKTELTRQKLVSLMVGRTLETLGQSCLPANREIALSVRKLSRRGRFRDVSFDVFRGEVVGLAGLMGAGRTDVVNAVYGLAPAESGEIRVQGKRVSIRSPGDGIRAGIGLVTEDRQAFGLVPDASIQSNITLAALKGCCRWGFIDHAAESGTAREQIRAFSIRAAGPTQPVKYLSGGNQQKVVLARTLLTSPDILLLDEPTRGIDLGAKAEVHELIRTLAQAGKAVVLVSSELPELLALTSRLLVMRQGILRAELETSKTTQEEVLDFAMPE